MCAISNGVTRAAGPYEPKLEFTSTLLIWNRSRTLDLSSEETHCLDSPRVGAIGLRDLKVVGETRQEASLSRVAARSFLCNPRLVASIPLLGGSVIWDENLTATL